MTGKMGPHSMAAVIGAVQKHLPNKHDQKTHGRPQATGSVGEDKWMPAAKQALATLNRFGGIATAKAIMHDMEPTAYGKGKLPQIGDRVNVVRASRASAMGLAVVKEDGHLIIADTPRNTKIVSSFKLLSNNLEEFLNEGGRGNPLQKAAKEWLGGKSNPGLEFLWAATQLAENGDVVMHRGVSIDTKTANRIMHGDVKQVDVDTIGHWSADFNTSAGFASMGNEDTSAVFITKIKKKYLLFSYKLFGSVGKEEKELIPIIMRRPRVRNFTATESSGDKILTVDLEFK